MGKDRDIGVDDRQGEREMGNRELRKCIERAIQCQVGIG